MDTDIVADDTSSLHDSGLPEAVQEALNHGRSIIPIQANKQPPQGFSWKDYQLERPSGADLTSWSLFYDPSAWAFITGEISGIVTLDFDGENGLHTLANLGPQPHLETPGGWHVYVKHPGWPVSTQNHKANQQLGRQFPGMDVKGDGGYSIFTGTSEHGEYQTLSDHSPLSLDELPSALQKYLRGNTRTEGHQTAHEPECQGVSCDFLVKRALEMVDKGDGRNDSGFWLAAQLRDAGLNEQDTLTIMRQYASQVPATDGHGRPEAYMDSEVRATVKSVFTRDAREPLSGEPSKSRPLPETGRFRPQSIDELEEGGSLESLIEGVLYRKTVNEIFGPSGGGKTFTVVDMGMSIATGTPWNGHAVTEGLVIYLAAEGRYGIPQRVRAWQQAHGGLSAENFLVIAGAPQLSSPQDVDDLIAGIKERLSDAPVAIFIDTLAQTFGDGHENDTRDMMKYVKGVQRLQEETDSTVILVHHTGRQGENPRGNSSLDAALQTIIKVEAKSRGLEISCFKQKDDEEFRPMWFQLQPICLQDGTTSSLVLVPSVPMIVPMTPVVKLSPQRQRVVRALAGYGAAGTSQAVLARATKVSPSTVSDALKVAETARFVEKFPGPDGDLWRVTAEGEEYLEAAWSKESKGCPMDSNWTPAIPLSKVQYSPTPP